METKKQDKKANSLANTRFIKRQKQSLKCVVEFTTKNAYLLTLILENKSAHKSERCREIDRVKKHKNSWVFGFTFWYPNN